MKLETLHGYLLIPPGKDISSFSYVSYYTRDHGKVRVFTSRRGEKYSSISLLRQPFIFFSIPARGKEGVYYPQTMMIDFSFTPLTYDWDTCRLAWFLLGFQEELLVRDDVLPSVYWGFVALCRNLVQGYSPGVKLQLALRFCSFLVTRIGFDEQSIFKLISCLREFTENEYRQLDLIIRGKYYPKNFSSEQARRLFLKSRIIWENLFDSPLKSFDYL